MPDKSDKEWFHWAQRLAYRSDEPLWWCNLAAFYATGRGCRQDLRRARCWYAKAARARYPRGMYELGCMFLEGEGGKKDRRRGEQLLSHAAQAGDIDAVKVLLHCYETGYYSIERSTTKAQQYQKLYKQLRRSAS